MRRDAQSGEGRIGLIIALAVVGIAIFLGIKIIPVRIAAYEFKDFVQEEAQAGSLRKTDAIVVQRILEKAEELEIPLKKQDLKVRRTQSEMIITAKYVQPIDLKVKTYEFRMDIKERAPLF